MRIAVRLAVAELLVIVLALLAPTRAPEIPARAYGPAPALAVSPGIGLAPSLPPSPTARPAGRTGAAMAYDPAHSTVVLFGGDREGRALDDTWTWNGSRWAPAEPAHRPSARSGAALAFDSQQGHLVLFGGEDAGGRLLADTWTWSGSDWVPVPGVGGPEPRRGAGLVYDASVGRLVLYGGAGAGGRPLHDTWTWAGTDWSPVSAASTPEVDVPGSAIGYDARAGRVVLASESQTWGLLAGSWSKLDGALPDRCTPATAVFDALVAAPVAVCATDPLSITAWDGKGWQPQPAQGAPPGRSDLQVAYDDRTTELVVFGGTAGGNPLDDTWTWTPGRGWVQD